MTAAAATNPEQLLFASTAAAFLDKEGSLARVRELHAAGESFDPDWWQRAAELGYDLTVDWREYPTALPMVEAMVGNNLDMGMWGNTPIIRGITSGLPYRALVGVGMIFTIAVAFDADSIYGTTTYPVTYAMIEVISSFGLFFLIITAFYSGELVWRDRQVRMHEIVDGSDEPRDLTTQGGSRRRSCRWRASCSTS